MRASADRRSREEMVRPAALNTAPRRTDDGVRTAAEAELGPEAAAAIPKSQRRPRTAVDPGAAAVVDAILASLPTRIIGESAPDRPGATIVSLHQIRNQSRSNEREFEALLDRLADLLDRAGSDSRVRFVSGPETDDALAPHYHLQGAAYLVTLEGFDQWELFLSMTEAGRNWSVWTAPGPVHVLRQPTPAASPQISLGW